MPKEILNDIKEEISTFIPDEVELTNIEFEGPEIAIYSKNPRILLDSREIVKDLAKKIRKRIVIRSDPSVRIDEEQAEDLIKKICPDEAGITNINFDTNLGEVVIEAKKPGLVIGRGGETLKEITRQILWRPSVVRTPPLKSKMVIQIRHYLNIDAETRKEILQNVGRRIHRPQYIKDESIRLTTLGGFREVGRMGLLVQTPESNVLIDCGVNIGSLSDPYPNLSLPEFNIENLDAVIISHAHLDHHGFVPFLFKYGYDGPIYCTKPTMNLMTLLQIDYLDIAQREGKFLPYGQRDVKKSVLHTIPLDYGEVTDIAPDVRLTLHNAGHILGSAIVHLHIGDGMYNLAYTGDFKFARTRLLEMANSSFPRLETLIMESTYGGPKDNMPSRRESENVLTTIINNTIRNNGKVLIPVLAVGRAQELIIVIEEKMRKRIIQEVPVYIDGMISEATAIHTTHPEYLSKDLRQMIFHQGHSPFLADYFVQVDSNTARSEITEGEPCIIMATSGMMTGGPSVEYFRLLAEDPRNTLIFVSYQVEGTFGRRIQKGFRDIQMRGPNGHLEPVKVKLNVITNEGFSGHSSRHQIMNFLSQLQPRPERIIVAHGEESKCTALAASIYKKYHIETRAPYNLETIRLK
ncbi:MAG: beta-CASP ribonuclease aCPSF1 [Candidatus Helarchaeota archaeon]